MKEKYTGLLEHTTGKPRNEAQWASNLIEFYFNSPGLVLAEYTQSTVVTKQRPIRTQQVTEPSEAAV